MKARYPLSAIIIALGIALGAILVACGGDESAGERDPVPTRSETPIPQAIDDYLQDIEDLLDGTAGEIGRIEATFENEFAAASGKESANDVLEDAIEDFQRIVNGASRGLRSLGPATEATIQHDALSAVLDRAVRSIDTLEEEYRVIRSGSDEGDVSPAQTALAARVSEAFALISTELEDACLDLQDLAVEQAVEIALICGEESPAPTGAPAPATSPAPASPSA